ncbi:MAG: GNAT family N-acetyltransferase [Alphaproteobacteria bacterium]|nr:GNAT family N-acetyltransferase [Alphaproteobacteria bacterium]
MTWTSPPRLDGLHIDTPRLVLRTLRIDDVDAIFASVARSRHVLLPWMTWAGDQHRDPVETTAWVASQVLVSRRPVGPDGVAVGMFGRDGRFVGMTGIHAVRPDVASVEIGYWVDAPQMGQGLCTEAMRHWLAWLLTPSEAGGMGLNKASVFCAEPNVASRRVAEKLGMTLEVQRRAHHRVEGYGVVGQLGWAAFAGEWQP